MTRNTTKTREVSLEEVYDALNELMNRGEVEAVCPCGGTMPLHVPGRGSLCGGIGISPKEVTYRAKKESTNK